MNRFYSLIDVYIQHNTRGTILICLILETGLRRLIEKSFKIVVMREKLFEKSHEVLENEVNTKTTSNFSTEFIYKNSFRRTQYLFKKENN